jgi:hypothetical protein
MYDHFQNTTPLYQGSYVTIRGRARVREVIVVRYVDLPVHLLLGPIV